MKPTVEKSYVYFGTKHSAKRDFKIGETANMKQRQTALWSQERTEVCRYVSFEATKEERLFIEAYLRSKYAANRNLCHYGNDHFHARTTNNLKGAENKFFVNVAEAFALLEKIKSKQFTYYAHVGKYDFFKEWLDEEEVL